MSQVYFGLKRSQFKFKGRYHCLIAWTHESQLPSQNEINPNWRLKVMKYWTVTICITILFTYKRVCVTAPPICYVLLVFWMNQSDTGFLWSSLLGITRTPRNIVSIISWSVLPGCPFGLASWTIQTNPMVPLCLCVSGKTQQKTRPFTLS